MYIIVGLGNPGREYEKTRHNAGYMAADALAEKLGITSWRKGFRSLYAEGRYLSERIVIAKPETYMNNSGFAVADLLNWFKPEHDHLIVLYDDIDLPVGALRIRASGSAGTHNGMRSVSEQLGFEDFPRVRIGIGKPEHGLIDHVLSAPNEEDAEKLRKALPEAAEAVLMITRGRLEEAQTKFNYKPPKKEKPDRSRHADSALCYRPSADAALFSSAKEVFFKNSLLKGTRMGLSALPYSARDVNEASGRLRRFAPLIARLFPETAENKGFIESPLHEAPALKKALLSHTETGGGGCGRVFLKLDSELPIAGSVKARGGVYEVLKHTEDLAFENGLLPGSYEAIADHRELFSKYTIQVGSTGNLGLSIGITASAIGYRTIVHMSADAKQWKKDMLRSHGVTVVEYESDYSEAVKQGRAQSDLDPMSYFIDDENSLDLFMGYAVAAERLMVQLMDAGVIVDGEHPLCVYLPCGVGGAPGGIMFGLKLIWGDNVRCYFVEPVNSPCVLAAFAADECVPVSRYSLSGKTDADGLAVGTASRLAFRAAKRLMDGEFTVADERLAPLVRLVYNTEKVFIEPSAAVSCAAFMGSIDCGAPRNACHVLWCTGGGLVPQEVRRSYIGRRPDDGQK